MSGNDNDGLNVGPQGNLDPLNPQNSAAREAFLNYGHEEAPRKKRKFNPMGPLSIFSIAAVALLIFITIGPDNILSSNDEDQAPVTQATTGIDSTVSEVRNPGSSGNSLEFETTNEPVEEPDFAFLPVEEDSPDSDQPQIEAANVLEKDAFEERMAELEKLISRVATSSRGSGGLTAAQLRELLQQNSDRMTETLQRQMERAEQERERLRADAAARDAAMRKRMEEQAARSERAREVDAERYAAAERATRERFENERKAAAARIAAAEKAADAARQAAAAATAASSRPAVVAPGTPAGQQASSDAAKKLEVTKRQSAALVMDISEPPPGGGSEAGASAGSADEAFLSANAEQNWVTVSSSMLPSTSSTVVQGTIISAVLETAITSELPGTLRAQVTEHVFSFDGKKVLMPAGTTLIGTYRNEVRIGQTRLLVAWNRAITPKGQSVALGSIGTDTLGRSGTSANVNNRLGQKLGLAAVVSLLSIAPELASAALIEDNDTEVSLESDTPNTVFTQESGSEVTAELADFLGEFLDQPSLLRVGQGEEIRVLVNRDLVFR
ncbi:MAG: TrbI/VirB10 family protein [Pseudomonadota bacterium]